MLLALVVAQPMLARLGPSASSDRVMPWPLGAVLLNVSTFSIAALALISRSALLDLRPLRLPLRAFVGLTALGVAQLLPLPEGVLDQIAPVNLKIYHETASILRPFRLSGPLPRISIAPAATEACLLRLAGGLLLMIAAISLLRTRSRRRFFGGVVVGSALIQAALLVGRRALRVGLPPSRPIEPVDLAVWLGIALTVAFGAFWADILTGAERGIDSADTADRLERRISPAAFRAVVWMAVAFAMVVTEVPAAIVGAGLVTVILLAMAIGRQRRAVARRFAAAALFMTLLLGGTIGARDDSPGDPSNRSSRSEIWKTSVESFRQFPYVGSGFGTFSDAFRRVQPRDLPGLVDRARSAPLELLVTGGIVGFGLGALGVVSFLACQIRAWRAQRHREESAIALAAFGAMLFWVLSGFAESSSSSLAVLPLLASVVGAGWAAGRAHGGRIA